MRKQVYNQIFSDKIWANGGAHTTSYITVKEYGSDRYLESNGQHKYSKCPAWMFHGTIYQGRDGPAVFWEKAWGSIDSAKYNQYILPDIQALVEAHPELTFMQDNAPSHRSRLTARNLARRGIRTRKWPPYSPDLNLIEDVWTWMKNYIQEQYFEMGWDVANMPLDRLRAVIWEAWEAVPTNFIENLVNSWWNRCRAVIDAEGGPTKY